MIEVRRGTQMEKLELLSATALLEQGIERKRKAGSEQIKSSSKCQSALVVNGSKGLVSGVAAESKSQNPPAATVGAIHQTDPRSKVGSSRETTTSPLKQNVNTTNGAVCNLASPVSTDIEDEDNGRVVTTASVSALGKNRHNLHITKARIIESRSPIPTVEYGHYVAAPLSSPYPTSPQSYGYSLLPHHNQILLRNHSHDQQEYPPTQYPNHGNIIRTMSEASFPAMYGSTLMPPAPHNGGLATNNSSDADAAAFQPPPRDTQPPRLKLQQRRPSPSTVEDMTRQIQDLREQLSEKDMVVSSLQHRVNYLENQIHELRQLPTGKISHIPVDDMIRIMQEYGSEVSNQTLPQQRKQNIKKASIVRQFRRWNPEFFRFFLHHNGEWVPKLGREGELRRRAEKRRLLLIAKQSATVKPNTSKK